VLRISTLAEDGSAVTLKVEGVVAGDWVPLLERECRRHLEAQQLVQLDFSWVTFLDREGAAMTRRLLAAGVHIFGASGLVHALLDEPGPSAPVAGSHSQLGGS
jgi:hypothetical protein